MRSSVPPAPEGVVLRVPVLDPATGVQMINDFKRPVWREYSCRVVYAGRLDVENGVQDIWQVVCDRWMSPGDVVVAGYVPHGAVLIGPPPAVEHAAQAVAHV
ncbi:hypothetical protein CH292_19095 [Rhodococcus sp. 14-2470-1a]|nr:hypothetical protein CH292_19095 [Rhodococcus sp. 14-2470-1a]